MAAAAALSRMNQTKPASARTAASSSVKSQVKQEMLAEEKARQKAVSEAARYAGPVEKDLDAHPAVGCVLFHCPLAGPDALPKDQMEAHIERFLLSQLAEEPAMTAALMIQTLNKNAEQTKQCIETLGKYLDNVVEHPGEEKYQRIRCSNKVLAEKVLSLRGGQEFVQAVGFERRSVAGADGTTDDYLVLPPEMSADVGRLTSLKEVLQIAEPIRPELDRDVHVFHPSSAPTRFDVPDEFYNASADEIKRELAIRQEAVEKMGMLRTKEMRERDRVRELRRYRYVLIRVRFPDGILLQGTFRANEKLSALKDFVLEALEHDWIPFALSNQLGSKLDADNLTFAELDLAPASIVQFAYDPDVIKEIASQQHGFYISSYLKPEFMARISSL